jgi:hypothetical protein
MYKVNDHIKERLLNEYRGSEQKETIILDNNKKYLLKKPDTTREKDKRALLSYINNSFSEYISCHIAQMLGFEVQNTILGEYTTLNKNGNQTTKIVCLCEDIRKKNESMREFDTISLSTDSNSKYITFLKVENIIEHISEILKLSEKQHQEMIDFYYNLFIFDAFIGNPDRHNGNVAILIDKNNKFTRISPIYDCGSSLLPLFSDDEISKKDLTNEILSVDSILYENNCKIRYNDFLLTTNNKNIHNALQTIIPKINLEKIQDFIEKTDYLSNERKLFYKNILQLRYNRILIPALQRTFYFPDITFKNNVDFYQFYKNNIKQIIELPLFQQKTLVINNNNINIMRINNKYALCLNKDKCIGVLPIRSNNNYIREAMNVLQTIGTDLSDFIEIKDNERNNIEII